jgi:hypothetical protein
MLSAAMTRHAGRHYGKYRGQVTATHDERHQGTIEVKVPRIFGPELSVPARACMPYGHFFVPPVGAHVWVEFEEGDIGRALWVGAWYPEGASPEPARIDPPANRVIQTPAGHTIEILDQDGEERIMIRHAKDAFMSIDPKGGVLISNAKGSHLHLDADGSKATLVEQHGNHLVMTSSGTALVNPSGTTLNLAGDTVHVRTKNVVVEASSVALGVGPKQPTILATGFKALWQVLLTHVHPTSMGPTLPSAELQPLQLVDDLHISTSVTVK